jgi:hypothetical protein
VDLNCAGAVKNAVRAHYCLIGPRGFDGASAAVGDRGGLGADDMCSFDRRRHCRSRIQVTSVYRQLLQKYGQRVTVTLVRQIGGRLSTRRRKVFQSGGREVLCNWPGFAAHIVPAQNSPRRCNAPGARARGSETRRENKRPDLSKQIGSFSLCTPRDLNPKPTD